MAEVVTDHPAAADGLREPLELTLFGGLQVQLGGCDVTARLPGRQGRALVAYLVLNRDRPVARDELLNVLWPARPPVSPDAALSSVLAKVRRVLPDVVVGRHALTLQLGPGSRLDVQVVDEQSERAERALADGQPEQALAAAQSLLEVLAQPLLPDLDDEWTDSWRRRFGALVPRALEIAAQAGLLLGDHELAGAERAARALVAREPFREGGYALLMQAQARQGNVAEALRTFERVRTFLRDELGASPSAPLVALHGRLLREDATAAPPEAPVVAEGSARALPAAT
ncbi:MAG: hypothetical protein QOD69_3276, partial [Solirubrobacteraceae bacterium]|nr:hypothetical protein [Solirubrobacteraceae bacterium]